MALLIRILVLAAATLTFGTASLAAADTGSVRHRERLPAGIREVDVRHAPDVWRNVTDPAKVARIVRWFDALPLAPRGVYHCPMIRYVRPTTFYFRAADGTSLARARAPGAAACGGSFDFRIGGRPQKPLLRERVLMKVGRLLGVRLS
jgi:hypothetical protein